MTAISATVPAPARRVSPLGGMRNTFTLTWRSVLKIRTNMEDVIGLSLQPIMFLLLFTYVFGGAIAHGSTHDYLQYELPGLLVMTVVFATLGTGLMLNQDISSGVFDRFRSLPIARSAPLAHCSRGNRQRAALAEAGWCRWRTDWQQQPWNCRVRPAVRRRRSVAPRPPFRRSLFRG